MFYKQVFGVISLILVIIAFTPFIKNVLIGKTKPHAFSWLIWLILTTIGFFIQISNGAGAGAWFNGLMIIICAIITVLGFIKGRKEIVFIDWVSLILAFISIYYWLIIKDVYLSLILVIFADFLGMFPTLRKSYIHPYSETYETYFINGFRTTLAIFALEKFTFLTASYHIYMIAANIVLVILIKLRRKIIKN